jgi:outer membrane protein
MMRRFSFLVLSACIFPAIMAQQNRSWSFQQCVDTALTRNIAIRQSQLSGEIDRINLQQSKANRIPSLNAGVNEGLNFGKSIDPVTNLYVDQAYHSTGFSVNSSINLFNGLQNRRTIQQNLMLLNAGKYDVEKVKNDVILDITTSYLQMIFSYEMLKAAQNQAEATAAQVDRTTKYENII